MSPPSINGKPPPLSSITGKHTALSSMSPPSITRKPPPLSSITGKSPPLSSMSPPLSLNTGNPPPLSLITGNPPSLSLMTRNPPPQSLITRNPPPLSLITGNPPPLGLFTGKPLPLSSITGKPVIVRVKRKASQAKLDSFWLEINERPRKKAFLGLGNLSLSDCGTGKVLNELASKKMLVHRLETVGRSQSVKDVLHSFLQPSRNTKEFKGRSKERRSLYKPDKKHDQLRAKAIKEHEDLARSARFEQIWKKRGSIDAEECSLYEKCHLYDVVRVDAEDETHQRVPKPKVAPEVGGAIYQRVPKPKVAPEVGGAIFDKYLPLLREFLPQAAEEIEHDRATTEDNFVYDIYTIGSGVDIDTDSIDEHPLIQVYVEDDYYDGSSQSDYESDDSNAENYPWNDYCDEESDFEDSDSIYDQSEEEDREDWRWGYR
ncbi:RNA-directed DNA methylation 4-like isoform X2 [Zingiber officinale]|uniref:RNA-directed DNA methylation 4-like isoform X2 n=1 Tax=Zingiber officinale TaxID=94328 RepID=UPI001C4CAB94|nr:RNA-directed DNA methylation 4-like isoform X2 [Zingiber officinale]